MRSGEPSTVAMTPEIRGTVGCFLPVGRSLYHSPATLIVVISTRCGSRPAWYNTVFLKSKPDATAVPFLSDHVAVATRNEVVYEHFSARLSEHNAATSAPFPPRRVKTHGSEECVIESHA